MTDEGKKDTADVSPKKSAKANGKKQPPPSTQPAPRAFRFRRGSHVELAHALLQKLEVVVDKKLRTPVFDEGSLYAYDLAKGIWTRVDEVRAGKIVQSFDAQSPIKLKDSDIRGALSCARAGAMLMTRNRSTMSLRRSKEPLVRC